ncbi:hypothetical protein B9Z45_16475, partial [Limnohabitans sp. 2KL-17]|uniref:IS3 family transposase n=1 Tax=Limnohabitans sp. 2KL-17 TaxID=1100704 RepID=UPI000DD19E0A
YHFHGDHLLSLLLNISAGQLNTLVNFESALLGLDGQFSVGGNMKSERIKKRIYQTRAEAKSEIFDYIEVFYNRVRRHKHLDQLSPHEFERQRQTAL